MLVRKSQALSNEYQQCMQGMTQGLHDATDDDCLRCLGSRLPVSSFSGWFSTRIAEYPFALLNAPPKGKILDIGSDTRFHCALLGSGVEDITFHKTWVDADCTGRVLVHAGNTAHMVWTNKCYEKYMHNLKGMWGLPEDLDWVPSEMFDTVYNLSVIEHVPVESFPYWADFMWRMLKPGGRCAITCDWFVAFGVGDGINGGTMNHDWQPFFSKWGVQPEQSPNELPWHPQFDSSLWDDQDVWTIKTTHEFAVYGMTFTKPLDA